MDGQADTTMQPEHKRGQHLQREDSGVIERLKRFDQVFKPTAVDNGSEFADFAEVAPWGAEVYFAHPDTSWKRSQNERPRRKLGYRTPEERFEAFLDKVYAA